MYISYITVRPVTDIPVGLFEDGTDSWNVVQKTFGKGDKSIVTDEINGPHATVDEAEAIAVEIAHIWKLCFVPACADTVTIMPVRGGFLATRIAPNDQLIGAGQLWDAGGTNKRCQNAISKAWKEAESYAEENKFDLVPPINGAEVHKITGFSEFKIVKWTWKD